MRYHNITKEDMLNGDGLRVVLWFAGCSHHCRNCQNPITWDPDGGLLFDESAKQEIFEELKKDYTSGITFSGGDPLYIDTRGGLLKDNNLPWKGSSNQRVIDVKTTLSLRKTVLYA